MIVLLFKIVFMKHAGGTGQETSSPNLDDCIHSFSDLTTELLQYRHKVSLDDS